MWIRRLIFLTFVGMNVFTLRGQIADYGIAALDRSAVSLSSIGKIMSVGTNAFGVYTISHLSEVSPADVKNARRGKKSPVGKEKEKNKKKRAASIPRITYFKAVKSNSVYDPDEVLTEGFTLSFWVIPFASSPSGSGYILYNGVSRAHCGIEQSTWGISVSKEYIRVYEKYIREHQVLEYRHTEKKDFFVTLVCRDRIPILYINGLEVMQGETSTFSPHPAMLTDKDCPTFLRFIGKHTDIHFFKRALGEKEIAGLYNQEYQALHYENGNSSAK